jgi:predicted RNA binding protein YcfA (HicA-like mRNA interferase family)
VKRSEFIRWLQQHGCVLHRNGGRHDIFINLQNDKKQPIPRHNEIDDMLVKHIKKQLGLND